MRIATSQFAARGFGFRVEVSDVHMEICCARFRVLCVPLGASNEEMTWKRFKVEGLGFQVKG